jgi:hypothetical protein
MTTKLTSPVRREIEIDGEPYTLTISSEGLRLVRKGHRKGHDLAWRALVGGDAALAAALNASVADAGGGSAGDGEPGGAS